jgi:colanic acid/amylovoran biosynthesis glycosyltransferase
VSSPLLENLRVLHSVDPYLKASENWIYPQITRVPGVEGWVLCQETVNLELFPIATARVLQRVRFTPQRSFLLQAFIRVAYRLKLDELRTARQIRPRRPQVLHSHFGLQGWRDLGLAERLGIPHVTSFYGYDAWRAPEVEPAWRLRYRALFERGRLFLVEGPAMRDRLRSLGCPDAKIVVQRLGVDLAANRYRQRTFPSPLGVLMVGRFVEKKGFADGLRACALALAAGADLRVTIVGDSAADDFGGDAARAEIERAASAPELRGRLTFCGTRSPSETRQIQEQHDVLLCPSKHASDGDAEGGSPVVLTEAMAQGLLCVGTAHCDIPSVIQDRVTGFLCPEGDPQALAELLARLDTLKADLPGITRSARKHVEALFNLELQMQEQAALYRRLATGAHREVA